MGKPDKAGRDFLTNENRIGRHDGTASEGPRAQLGAGVPEANAKFNLEVISAALIALTLLITWFFS